MSVQATKECSITTKNIPDSQRRDGSQTSKPGVSKFLKRKPDNSRPFGRSSSRRKRDYDNEDSKMQDIQSAKEMELLGLSSNITMNEKESFVNPQPAEIDTEKGFRKKQLITVRSESSLQRNGKAGSQTSRPLQSQRVADNRQIKFVKNRQTFNPDYGFNSSELSMNSLPRATVKKSKTEFFSPHLKSDFQESLVQSELASQDYDMSRTTTMQENWAARNKLLEREIQLCIQREELLKMEKTHLQGLLCEKEKVINRLQRQKSFIALKAQAEIEQVKNTFQQQMSNLGLALSQEEKRSKSLKEENQFLQEELMKRSQELMEISRKNVLLEKHCRTVKAGKKSPEDGLSKGSGFDVMKEFEKTRQTNLKQQEQIRYLRVQNQCLRMSRDQVKRLEKEVGRLKEERDFFKKKVLEHIKKHNKLQLSEEGSSLFELSEVSLDI